MKSSRALLVGLVMLIIAGPIHASIEIKLKNTFIQQFKDRATIDATFTVDKAHAHPNAASKDGDLHVAGRAPEIGLAAVAEVMNAKFEDSTVDLIHSAESSGNPVAIKGVWRLWCEHGGDTVHQQGDPLGEFNTTNPDHVFEIHPVLRVGSEDDTDSLKPITGFKYKDAERAFTAYENVRSKITRGATHTTISTDMAGFNYVEFMLELNEEPTHVMADGGVSVFATVKDLNGDVLVRNRRMVFAPGTTPFENVRALHQGDEMHVVGVPRISLALVAWRVENGGSRPEVLQWSLPYEIVVVADFADAAPADGEEPVTTAPKTADQVITILARLLSEETSDELDKGACSFNAGSLTFCADVTETQCTALSGTWSSTTACGGTL